MRETQERSSSCRKAFSASLVSEVGSHLLALAIVILMLACSPSTGSSRPSSPLPLITTCKGVHVAPSTDLQALMDANPPRTTFCFGPGLYLLSGTIHTADRLPILDLRAGAVIDGQNGGFFAIDGQISPANQPGTVVLGCNTGQSRTNSSMETASRSGLTGRRHSGRRSTRRSSLHLVADRTRQLPGCAAAAVCDRVAHHGPGLRPGSPGSGARAARLAAAIFWLYPGLIFANTLLLTETVFTFWLVAFVLLLVRLIQAEPDDAAWLLAIGAGAALGCSALTRSVLWPLPALLCPLLVWLLSGSW